MDKSSSRIETLLKLAADEDKETSVVLTGNVTESAVASVQKYYEEQTGDSVEALASSSDVEINQGNSLFFLINYNGIIKVALYTVDEDGDAENVTTCDSDQKKSLPMWLKIAKPEFVLEILAEDEEEEFLNKSNKTLSPLKKLVLFESFKCDQQESEKLSDSEAGEDEDKISISLNGTIKHSFTSNVHQSTPIVCHKPSIKGKSQPSPSPMKKLKFHETSLQHETGKRKISTHSSSSETVKLSQSWSDGNKTSSSSHNIDTTFVCRRPDLKRSQLVSAPKRFKLV